ncbi:MAG: DUF1638 family protein [Candidatus Methanohalarchaeum thermophilum]|uniref:DUF1638 family protein n=1 Tax=Methanohalarchaeum thermophilum TaxID=1903181 RepID=A0A1Q6DVQ7_METT1|nr:MAG: DUF1638 family protein [Candidatus Methanohalarchaeum thermophilum]
MFLDEVVYLLTKSEQIKNVYCTNYETIDKLTPKLKEKNLFNLRKKQKPDIKNNSIILSLKSIGLHRSPKKLRKDVIKELDFLSKFTNRILFFYGSCGNAFDDINEIEDQLNVELIPLKRSNGLVDDCISFTIGGTRDYLKEQKKEAGTFFMTPCWARNWKKMFEESNISDPLDNIDNLKMLFEKTGYKRILKLETGLGDKETFDEQVQEFSRLFNLDVEVKDCGEVKKKLNDLFNKYKSGLN